MQGFIFQLAETVTKRAGTGTRLGMYVDCTLYVVYIDICQVDEESSEVNSKVLSCDSGV
jgi:hypothetical protein